MYVRGDGLGAVIITDADYPHRVAHTLLTKILDDVATKVEWKTANPESLRTYKGETKNTRNSAVLLECKFHLGSILELDMALVRYQDPKQADALTKIQAELDETKIIMVKGLTFDVPGNRC